MTQCFRAWDRRSRSQFAQNSALPAAELAALLATADQPQTELVERTIKTIIVFRGHTDAACAQALIDLAYSVHQ